jgi:hypothetical protein
VAEENTERVKEVKRVVLVLTDYPEFDQKNFEDIRFQVFEIWTNSQRCTAFTELMKNYYNKIYSSHKIQDNAKTPAPKNFWPYSYQFYKCNPIKVFSCYVKNANTKPEINIEQYIEPSTDRTNLPSELMPSLVAKAELKELIRIAPKDVVEANLVEGKTYEELKELLSFKKLNKSAILSIIPTIDETLRNYLPLRDTDKIFTIKTKHIRH